MYPLSTYCFWFPHSRSATSTTFVSWLPIWPNSNPIQFFLASSNRVLSSAIRCIGKISATTITASLETVYMYWPPWLPSSSAVMPIFYCYTRESKPRPRSARCTAAGSGRLKSAVSFSRPLVFRHSASTELMLRLFFLPCCLQSRCVYETPTQNSTLHRFIWCCPLSCNSMTIPSILNKGLVYPLFVVNIIAIDLLQDNVSPWLIIIHSANMNKKIVHYLFE